MKKKIIVVATVFVVALVTAYGVYNNQNKNALADLVLDNVEALANPGEYGAECPSGCRSIGWGWDKILECDCNYDHFSSCNSWGC